MLFQKLSESYKDICTMNEVEGRESPIPSHRSDRIRENHETGQNKQDYK